MKKKILKGFTLAEESCHFVSSAVKIGRDCDPLNQSKNKIFTKLKAFTLAEVLITLAIIGVVASLTIPTLVTNYKKKTYVTQLKKTYNYLTNGFHQIMANDGVSNLTDTKLWAKMDGIHGRLVYQTEFVDELKKTFNIAVAYDSENMPEENKVNYKSLSGGDGALAVDWPNSYPNNGIYLNDGTFLFVSFPKTPTIPVCGGELVEAMPGYPEFGYIRQGDKCASLKDFQEFYNTPTKLWQNLGYIGIDVNGIKGPNQLGRDYFLFLLGNDGTLYPAGGADSLISGGCEYSNLNSCLYKGIYSCDKNTSGMISGLGCAGRIMEEGWEMKY